MGSVLCRCSRFTCSCHEQLTTITNCTKLRLCLSADLNPCGIVARLRMQLDQLQNVRLSAGFPGFL